MAQRWVAAVLRHETNTFSPIATPVKDFGRVGPTDGPATGQNTWRFYRDTNNPVAAYIDLTEEEGRRTRLSLRWQCSTERTRAEYHT